MAAKLLADRRLQCATHDLARTLRQFDGSLGICDGFDPSASDIAALSVACDDWLKIITKQVEEVKQIAKRRFNAKLRRAAKHGY